MKSLILGLTAAALFGLTSIATAGVSTESSMPGHMVLAGNEEMANSPTTEDTTGGAPTIPGDNAVPDTNDDSMPAVSNGDQGTPPNTDSMQGGQDQGMPSTQPTTPDDGSMAPDDSADDTSNM